MGEALDSSVELDIVIALAEEGATCRDVCLGAGGVSNGVVAGGNFVVDVGVVISCDVRGGAGCTTIASS